MAHLLALYNEPKDPTAFEQYYHGTHVPLAKKMPGLRSYTVSTGALAAAAGNPPYYLIAVLEFDSVAAIQAAVSSPEGAAAVSDVPNFATGGATILMYETQAV
ncbi:MAG: EthD family reductase [Candidatus Eremiobacteraeota bacterium]|nr:EthD family reductase [Candidatus Eremiobacteraeota bacterium]